VCFRDSGPAADYCSIEAGVKLRVPDRSGEFIGYRLNILGVRVWKNYCRLVAKDATGAWTPLGPPRPLPIIIPGDPSSIASDALLLTIYQYDVERPGSDLRQVLAQNKEFELALGEDQANHETSKVARKL
jgi:hypothetical protein